VAIRSGWVDLGLTYIGCVRRRLTAYGKQSPTAFT
jgi:hypothetical protein